MFAIRIKLCMYNEITKVQTDDDGDAKRWGMEN